MTDNEDMAKNMHRGNQLNGVIKWFDSETGPDSNGHHVTVPRNLPFVAMHLACLGTANGQHVLRAKGNS